MIVWRRLEAGEYESEDERFYIIKTWDRIHLLHWFLRDRNTNKEYTKDSLKECQRIAELILQGVL